MTAISKAEVVAASIGRNNRWRLAFAIGTNLALLLGCTSSSPTTPAQPAAPPPTADKEVVTATTQKPSKPAHECVTTELSQMYVQDSVRLAFGEGDTYLHYCFVCGYQGIDCGDNWGITHALGHGLSNRERAKCDAIMRRLERHDAAEDGTQETIGRGIRQTTRVETSELTVPSSP